MRLATNTATMWLATNTLQLCGHNTHQSGGTPIISITFHVLNWSKVVASEYCLVCYRMGQSSDRGLRSHKDAPN